MKKITLSLITIVLLAFLFGSTVAFAQNNTAEVNSVYSYQTDAKPVGFGERVKLFFTFNKDSKIKLLQEFSNRNFELAQEKISEGDTEKAEQLFEKSDKNINKATDFTFEIQDKEKQKKSFDNIATTVSNRTLVLEQVKDKIENPKAQETINNALQKQVEAKVDIDAKMKDLLNKISGLEAKIKSLQGGELPEADIELGEENESSYDEKYTKVTPEADIELGEENESSYDEKYTKVTPEEEINEQAVLLDGQCPGFTVDSPVAGELVTFPLTITGTIHSTSNPGPWIIFEGEAGSVRIQDTNGGIRSDIVLLSLNVPWMNSNPKPFSVIIPALTSTPYTNNVNLVFKDNNVAGPNEGQTHQCVLSINVL